MRFLTNMQDPRKAGWERYQVHTFHGDPATENAHTVEWLSDKWIGKPKATADYTTKQLRKMGLVGIYAYDNPKIQRNPIRISISVSTRAAQLQLAKFKEAVSEFNAERVRAAFDRWRKAGDFAAKFGSPAATFQQMFGKHF